MNLFDFFYALVAALHVGGPSETGRSELQWWQTAIFYQVYPRSFCDANADGIGDLKGIVLKADHLKDLGVGGVWISPFFKSPMKDFGYDIEDYREVDPMFGTLDDFKKLARELKDRGIYIVMDFVPNHTSDKSEWFRKSEDGIEPYANYYVWVDGKGPDGKDPPNNWISVFGDSAWQWSPKRKQFYLHQFLKEQPDLNYRNKHVREEMKSVVRFWLEQGVGGFRIDALKFLFEDEDLRDEAPSGLAVKPNEYDFLEHNLTTNLPETYDVLGEWKDVFNEFEAKDGFHRVIMVEVVGLSVRELAPYFGTPERPLADIPFNFDLMNLRKGFTARQVQDIVEDWLKNLPPGKWPNWVLSNHDQNRMTNKTDVQLVDAFHMLTLLMKGTPVTYYGEEIGMVDGDISWNDTRDPAGIWAGPDGYKAVSRDPERTPMQWSAEKFAGFTKGSSTWLPVNPDYETVNVEKQNCEPRSHLNTYKRLSKLRTEAAFREGKVHFPYTTDSVLTFARAVEGQPAYVVAINFGDATERVDLVREGEADDFEFPLQGIVKANSHNVPDGSPLADLDSHVGLDAVELGPMQAVVLQFEPKWGQSRNVDDKDWWKKSIFYQVYPRSFCDSNGDGIGDLNGVKEKAAYFEYIGANGVWLSPFYESPMKDFGYDIKNYTKVDPLFGTLEDFKSMLQEMTSKKLKVVVDFVPNHSSNESVWFQKSKRREEPYTDYYVWVDGKGPNKTDPPNNWMSMFGGSAWEWCPTRKQFYYHQFLKAQPDLNMRNPKVREELKKVLKFWLDLGVSGIRIDAIKHLFEDPQLRDEPRSNIPGVKEDEYIYLSHIYTTSQPEIFDVLREWRHVFDDFEKADGFHRIMMVEINETIPKTAEYYGNDTDPLADMPFNFELFKIANTSTADEIYQLIKGWLDGVAPHWPNWVIGNHDQHRIANRSHPELIDAFNMINLLLKGTPVVYYGEEIGMVDTKVLWNETQDPSGLWYGPDRYEKFSRDPERTPMQWSAAKFAGFTTGDKPWLPVNPNYKTVNVEVEKTQDSSHLQTFRRLVTLRRNAAFRDGKVSFPLVTEDVLTFARVLPGKPSYVVLVNFGSTELSIDLAKSGRDEHLKFPRQGTVRARSRNIPPTSPLSKLDHPVQLSDLVLVSRGAVVIEFVPQG